MYIVRRLTPLECCRLQGFPDGWTENLGTDEPTEQEIARWFEVFEDWYRANGKNVGPSRSRIVKWLKDPRTDAAEYKAYGNSVAVPCVFLCSPASCGRRNRRDAIERDPLERLHRRRGVVRRRDHARIAA